MENTFLLYLTYYIDFCLIDFLKVVILFILWTTEPSATYSEP